MIKGDEFPFVLGKGEKNKENPKKIYKTSLSIFRSIKFKVFSDFRFSFETRAIYKVFRAFLTFDSTQ